MPCLGLAWIREQNTGKLEERGRNGPMSKPGPASMHYANLVQILPAGERLKVQRNKLDQIAGQKVLSEADHGVVLRQVLERRRNNIVVARLARHERLGRDVEREQLVVDGLHDGGDQRGHDWGCCPQGFRVICGETDEFAEVVYAAG